MPQKVIEKIDLRCQISHICFCFPAQETTLRQASSGNHYYNTAPDRMSEFFRVAVLPHVCFNYLIACVCLFIHSKGFYQVSTYLPEYRLSVEDIVVFTTDLVTSLIEFIYVDSF